MHLLSLLLLGIRQCPQAPAQDGLHGITIIFLQTDLKIAILITRETVATILFKSRSDQVVVIVVST